jgi:hypothetical protein
VTELEAQPFRKLHGKKDQLKFVRARDPMVMLNKVDEAIFGHATS